MTNAAFSDAALRLMSGAVGRALCGGELRIYEGRRNGESTLLGVLRFPANPLSSAPGWVRFGAFEKTKALAMGDAHWFEGCAASGAQLVVGTVGTKGADMLVDDVRVYPGMELTLPGFECVVTLT